MVKLLPLFAQARLHKQRKVNVRPTLTAEEEAAVLKSKQNTDAKLGKVHRSTYLLVSFQFLYSVQVKNDSPELLNALLKWYQSDVEMKQHVLENFFMSLQKDDLDALAAVVKDDSPPPSTSSTFLHDSFQCSFVITCYPYRQLL